MGQTGHESSCVISATVSQGAGKPGGQRARNRQRENKEEEEEKGPLLGQGLLGESESRSLPACHTSECQVENLPRPGALDQVKTSFLKTGPIKINGLKICQSFLEYAFFLFYL